MISFPNSKINLGLKITGKRDDGFHNLQSLFYPVQLCDILEITESGKDSFTLTGLSVPGESSSNLVIKALELVRMKFEIPPLDIHLHKHIPLGAGLGGGSSDGAFMIKMLNEYFSLKMSEAEMMKTASLLGSDCSFFIRNIPAMAEGRGEILSEYSHILSGKYLALLFPGIAISTREAFTGVNISAPCPSIPEVIAKGADYWKDELVNDFEKSIFLNHPVLAEIKNFLYARGAVYASMSGSGSTLFGIFSLRPELGEIPGCQIVFSEIIK